jgi:hypothetical protein
MGCNCQGAAAAKSWTLIKASGDKQTYASRTEAIAAMTIEPGSKVVSVAP